MFKARQACSSHGVRAKVVLCPIPPQQDIHEEIGNVFPAKSNPTARGLVIL